MGRFLSDIFDWFLDISSLGWFTKLVLSGLVFAVLIYFLGD